METRRLSLHKDRAPRPVQFIIKFQSGTSSLRELNSFTAKLIPFSSNLENKYFFNNNRERL